MKAEVPYLARLARQAAGQPALRPPRQLFSGDIDLPVDSPGYLSSPRRHAIDAAAPRLLGSLPASDGGDEQATPEASAPASGADRTPTAGPPGGSAAEPVAAGNVPATPAQPEPAAATRTTPERPDLPRPPRAVPQRPGAGHAEVSGAAVASPADIRPVPPPAEPGPARDARPAVDRPARPPESWARSLRDGSVDLPDALEPAPRASQADRRAAPVPRAVPAGPGPNGPAGSRQDQDADEAGDAAAHQAALGPGAPPAATIRNPARPREPTAVRDLMPQSASDPPPVAMSRTGPGEPRVPRRPRVSIGTIEVTVVPPTPPAPAVPEIRLPAPVTPGWSRPPSPFAASEGADRLRHGLRRWYGTAQE
jgi:hypothetical protein